VLPTRLKRLILLSTATGQTPVIGLVQPIFFSSVSCYYSMDQIALFYTVPEYPRIEEVNLLYTYTSRTGIRIWHIVFVNTLNTSFLCLPSWVASEPGKWEALFLMSHSNSSVAEVANNCCFQYRKQHTVPLFLFYELY